MLLCLYLIVNWTVFSMSLCISKASGPVALPICWSVCVCVLVGRSVWKVYCGKMAEWIRMPFGMVSGFGLGLGVLDGGGYRQRGRGSLC